MERVPREVVNQEVVTVERMMPPQQRVMQQMEYMPVEKYKHIVI